jgi:hypothetical protein
MAARSKDILIVSAESYTGDEIVNLELVETKRKGVMIDVDKAEELIDQLINK